MKKSSKTGAIVLIIMFIAFVAIFLSLPSFTSAVDNNNENGIDKETKNRLLKIVMVNEIINQLNAANNALIKGILESDSAGLESEVNIFENCQMTASRMFNQYIKTISTYEEKNVIVMIADYRYDYVRLRDSVFQKMKANNDLEALRFFFGDYQKARSDYESAWNEMRTVLMKESN